MTVQTNNNSISYVGNGSTVHFDYDFLILGASHLKVYFGDVLQTSGYVVSGVGSQTGGTVAFAVAPPNGANITLIREVPFLQLTDYQPYDAFPAESHERALDLLTMMAQQLKDELGRTMQHPVGGNKWDARGNEITNVGTGNSGTSAANVNQVRYLIASEVGNDPSASASARSREALRRSYAEAGFNLVDGSFEAGGTLTSSSDVLLHETSGKAYSWAGSFPKTVAPGTDPTAASSGYTPRTDVMLRNELALDGGAGLIGDIAKPITHFGATHGSDCSSAVLAAMSSNKPFFFPDGEWLCTGDINFTGAVNFHGVGSAIIKSDKVWTITDGSGSSVSNVKFMPITTPYTLKRNTTTWSNAATDVIQSTEGYQPTALDVDIWDSLPTAIKNQAINETISNGLVFKSSTVFGISDIHVRGVSGRCCRIQLFGAINSSVDDCKDIGGGPRNCIEFFNGAVVGGTLQLPRGSVNSITNCSTRYASQCGIVYWGQDNIKVIGNTSISNGESGIKCYQRDTVWSSAISSQGDQIIGNTTAFNYYDGIDAQRFYETSDAGDVCLATIVGNTSFNNRHTGITTNGKGGTAASNTVYANGSHGLSVKGNNWSVSGNNAKNNALLTNLGFSTFDILLQGDGINSSGNHAENSSAPFTYNYVHTGALAADPDASNPGSDVGNTCSHGPARMFVSVNLRGSNWKNISVISGSSYIATQSDYQLDIYPTSTFTITLPSAADNKGRIISIRNTNTYAINSASTNIGPLAGGAPTGLILSNISGKWCELQSDGSVWKIMKAN